MTRNSSNHPFVESMWLQAFHAMCEAAIAKAHARCARRGMNLYTVRGLSGVAEKERRAVDYWTGRMHENVALAMKYRRDAKLARAGLAEMSVAKTEPPPSDVCMVAGE